MRLLISRFVLFYAMFMQMKIPNNYSSSREIKPEKDKLVSLFNCISLC